jgi:hypothetical protein
VIALAIVLSCVVGLLALLVAGLLRSHADILKALHDLGVGVGEPSGAGDGAHLHDDHAVHDPSSEPTATGASGTRSSGLPLTMGPPLPGERNSTSVPTIAGVTPGGDAVAVSLTGDERLTLLAFLSSGCTTCAGFWRDFQRPDHLGLPAHTRLVVVTKGPEMESPMDVGSQAPRGLTVVMSTEAWSDYEVPGSPFFVLVDGPSGRRIGEGVANHFHQVAELVRRAEADARGFTLSTTTSRATAQGLDGPQRERANDQELAAAGILPGDPSLYPSSLADLHGSADPRAHPGRPSTGGTVTRIG